MGVGASLESKYYLQKVKLGQGSFGVVLRGVNKATGEVVAVKQMDTVMLPRRGVQRADIEREVAVMKALNHPHCLRLLDSYEDDWKISFVLEYCDGGDFGDKVQERSSSLTEPEAADWTRQILDAINYMHNKEFCHRDIKPDNFMINLNNQLKLADFGLAISCPRGKLLTEKCGTPAFMAPEQHALGGKSRGYSLPADIWAVGVTMFMLMSGGRHPFVDSRNQLDNENMTRGVLDFSGGIFGLVVSRSRFSDAARELCKKMVEPSQSKRLTSGDAIKDGWLLLAKDVRWAEGPAKDTAQPADLQPKASRTKSAPEARSVLQDGSANAGPPRRTKTGLPQEQNNIVNNNWLGNWIFGKEDENAGPNVPKDDEDAAQRRRIELLTTKQKQLAHDSELHQENVELRQQLQELTSLLENEKNKAAKIKRRSVEVVQEVRRKAQQQVAGMAGRMGYPNGTDKGSVQAPVAYPTERSYGSKASEPAPYNSSAPSGIGGTARQSGIERRSTRELGALHLDNKAPAGSWLPKGTKCRYNSSSYPGWLNAVVETANDDGTYDLDIRQRANIANISPTPDATQQEAWPVGTWVTYESSTMNRSLPAKIVSYNVPGGGLKGTYNLDLRECADVERIRPRRTTPESNQTNI